jgi:hypothetical protein
LSAVNVELDRNTEKDYLSGITGPGVKGKPDLLKEIKSNLALYIFFTTLQKKSPM